MASSQPKPNYFWSMLTMKCPRCRKGPMYTNNNPWNLKNVFSMYERCPECTQKYEMEVGFWYGTAYVSYALSVAFCVASFVAWYVLIGMSTKDDRVFWWMGINITMLIFLQPWLMRISRVIYLYFFVSYDANYKNTKAKTFDYETDSYNIPDDQKGL
ncbi:MAG: DUF983 domain-containing protein [Chitinophagaceae bacterium]|nr:MAG: DUF983 domain-containing protein [Chitinophagaceae bacterium]